MGWNASRQARRALADALPLMTAAESVDLLIVDPEGDEARHGEEPGADIAGYLVQHQVPVAVRCLASRGAQRQLLLGTDDNYFCASTSASAMEDSFCQMSNDYILL